MSEAASFAEASATMDAVSEYSLHGTADSISTGTGTDPNTPEGTLLPHEGDQTTTNREQASEEVALSDSSEADDQDDSDSQKLRAEQSRPDDAVGDAPSSASDDEDDNDSESEPDTNAMQYPDTSVAFSYDRADSLRVQTQASTDARTVEQSEADAEQTKQGKRR
jgi:hypothetical protein